MSMINDASNLDLEDLDYTPELPEEDVTDSYEVESDINSDQNDFDLTQKLLEQQGIVDKDKIKFEDESGAVVEKSWDDLSNNEKLMILSHQEDPDISLDSNEIQFINQIRASGLTPGQYIQYVQQLAQPEPQPIDYEVDSLSDDQLFCLDLLDKVGAENITDEELQEALEHAKLNPSLYEKQVASLRSQYRDLEEQRQLDLMEEEQQKLEQKYQYFANDILNAIGNFNNFADTPVALSRDEMNDLANYVLTRDSNGVSEFGRILKDPVQFTKAAFWMLKGPEILNEMQHQIKEAYLRGYNENKKSQQKQVITKSSSKSNGNKGYASFDEDSYLNN